MTVADEEVKFPIDVEMRLCEIKEELKDLNKAINKYKTDFKEEISRSSLTRAFRNEQLKDSNVISIFESSLTRTVGMKTNELYDGLLVIRVYYYEILKDLMLNGFLLNGEKFVFFTASAGQIRTKKVVFIKESLWLKHRDEIMCGISPELIEAKGGTNRNKYLAYLALCNSATDEWGRFDIRKTIVVDDMETVVTGVVDYIDDTTFDITRKEMGIPIAHTDGCGMILPRVSKKNFMVRMPWIKGLLAAFPYDQFIREADARDPSVNHALVKDIYGKQHDVLAEGIEIIFSKSQFKMWKFYDDWDDYIAKFIENHCTAGICNVEENYIPRAKLNYQMLQTLTDMTRDEMGQLASKSAKRIRNIATSRSSKLEAFGATKENLRKNEFQKCLLLYPELLSTAYVAETLRQIKDSLVCEGRAGKIDIESKYLFLIPDLYAFCQRLFLGEENPSGLLKDGEVFCSTYAQVDKLDCLRAPHLGKEHVVRRNVIDDGKRRWFTTQGIYTSCHDLISKILMFDNDGDKALVVADQLFVSIAERNSIDVVPPYYKMGKAGSTPLTQESLYDGLILAYQGGKIGIISNDITKIWNSDNVDYPSIQILCALCNFTIDYAKTLYMPTFPYDVNERIKDSTRFKTPHFFVYAKGKTDSQVEKKNDSVVNMLEDIIVNTRMKNGEKTKSSFNYMKLMYNPEVVENEEIVKAYKTLYKRFRSHVSSVQEDTPFLYIKMESLSELSSIAGSPSRACDMLVHYLFKTKNSAQQKLFWICFADIVLTNLESNLEGTMYCANCGARIKRESNSQKLCGDCAGARTVERVVTCVDCGGEFVVSAKTTHKKRCPVCQSKVDLQRYREYNKKRKQPQIEAK